MARDGLNSNSLSRKTNGKTTQPQIHRFLNNQVKEPKRSTLRPVADFFKVPVDAFFDEAVARSKRTLPLPPDSRPRDVAKS